MKTKRVLVGLIVMVFVVGLMGIGHAKVVTGPTGKAKVEVSGTVVQIKGDRVTTVDAATGASVVTRVTSTRTGGTSVVKGVVGIKVGDPVTITNGVISFGLPAPKAAP